MKITLSEITEARLFDYGQRLVFRMKGCDSMIAVDSPMSKASRENSNDVRNTKYDEVAQAKYKDFVRKVMEHVGADSV